MMNASELKIGRWISIIHRHRQNYLTKRLEAYRIGSGQHVFLMILSRHDGISQEQLSEYMKIDKATTAKAIKKLENEGYIRREVDPRDKRAYKVFLTPKGVEVIPAIKEAIQDWERMATNNISEDEIMLLMEILGKMAENACEFKEKRCDKP